MTKLLRALMGKVGSVRDQRGGQREQTGNSGSDVRSVGAQKHIEVCGGLVGPDAVAAELNCGTPSCCWVWGKSPHTWAQQAQRCFPYESNPTMYKRKIHQ